MPSVIAKHRNVNRDIVNPKIRFSDFKDNWKEAKFCEVFRFHSTNSLSRDALTFDPGKIRNIHYGDIHTKYHTGFDIEKETVPYIREDLKLPNISEDSYCKKEDIVFADASEDYEDIGKSIEIINIGDEKVLAGLHTLLARQIANTFVSGFSGYLMKSNTIRRQIMILAQGTKVLGISAKYLNEIFFKYPTLAEQQKIADFLSSVDSWVENLKSQKDSLESYKKGIMQKIFSQEIRFKDDKGNNFPNWEEKKLGDQSEFFSGGTPSSTNKSYYSGKIPFIKSGEISAIQTDQFITEEALRLSSAKMVSKGDLLYALYGATSGAVSVSKIDGAINQAVLCIRTKQDKNWLLYYLGFNKNRILSRYLQGGQGNLSADIIKKLSIKFPSLLEQNKIANFLSSIDEIIESKHGRITQAKAWKKGLMQQVFI